MKRALLGLGVVILLVGLWAAVSTPGEYEPPNSFPVLDSTNDTTSQPEQPELATFGSGCFWCTEAVFRRVKGVKSVVSGYSGGKVVNPSYEQVCLGNTGHAEVVQVTFDPRAVSFAELLEVFWRSHDPTTHDRQGFDEGPQYRSAIFYHSDQQRALAERYKRKIDEVGVYKAPLATEVVKFSAFYPAGADHQDYYSRNARQPYCKAHIGRKLDRLKAVFGDRLITTGS